MQKLFILITIVILILSYLPANGQTIETLPDITSPVVFSSAVDIHLTNSDSAIAKGATVDLQSPDAWLFFDNVKPNDVVKAYSSYILINGQPMVVKQNARVTVYKSGAVVMAHSPNFEALTVYSQKEFSGEEERFVPNYYYSNCPPDSAPSTMRQPLKLDNIIHSFVLRRGYMATMACESNGMGYSRVFIADDADIRMDEMPDELNGKVSYIRVICWRYPSKKGWAGSTWSAMPEGLKYAPQQCDFTNSTWYYNWGTRPSGNTDEIKYSLNQEFVPEKWGAGGSWNGIYSIEDASHLLGYNEPDHSEQSNVSVAKAIEEWPLMLQTGMRLGSPATTNFTWLYNFMSEARKRNYRVDFVVVHAYWGGLSGSEWYEKLKVIHERTGRPLWIKEWNNGANWTKEGWPSGTDEQYARQLRDLKDILTVMDTCSFIERYSIYNWVEDKRMIISSSAKLTPAGEYYAANQPDYFFNRSLEVVPTWSYLGNPILTYKGKTDDNLLSFDWTDQNGEQVDSFLVEKSTDFGQSYQLEKSTDCYTSSAEIDVADELFDVQYRVTSVFPDEIKNSSNAVVVKIADNEATMPLLSETLVRESWQPLFLLNSYPDVPAVLLGIPTYRNKMPLCAGVKNVNSHSFEFRLGAWDYQQNPVFLNPDTLAYLTLPFGHYDWEGVEGEVGFVEAVSTVWQEVEFAQAFDTIPVVIASPNSLNSGSAFEVCVCDVTNKGFRLCVRFEEENAVVSANEKISYIAATPGHGRMLNRELIVGCTEDNVVGDNLSGGYELQYGVDFTGLPSIFGAMQTANDSITATLRVSKRSCSSATFIKDREKSQSYVSVIPERLGYLIIGDITPSYISHKKTVSSTPYIYNHSSRTIHLLNEDSSAQVKIYNLMGKLIFQSQMVSTLSLCFLPLGTYFISINGCIAKIICH